MNIKITEKDNNAVLRDFLCVKLRLSRAMIIRLKKDEDGILLNGDRVTVRAVLHTDDMLVLKTDDAPENINANIVPVCLPLDNVYEDGDIVCVNKAPGMPTHPTHGHYDDTLANALAYKYSSVGIPFVFRAVNRLDCDTSGLVLIAKNKPASAFLARQIAERQIKKEYIAVASGKITQPHGIIKTYIKRADKSIITRENCDSGIESEYAETEYFLLCANDETSAVRVCPHTGRTHQIRVHLAGIGHPLIGDFLYGCETDIISRQALHCFSLSFTHPTTGEIMKIEAPVPYDIQKLMDRIK